MIEIKSTEDVQLDSEKNFIELCYVQRKAKKEDPERFETIKKYIKQIASAIEEAQIEIESPFFKRLITCISCAGMKGKKDFIDSELVIINETADQMFGEPSEPCKIFEGEGDKFTSYKNFAEMMYSTTGSAKWLRKKDYIIEELTTVNSVADLLFSAKFSQLLDFINKFSFDYSYDAFHLTQTYEIESFILEEYEKITGKEFAPPYDYTAIPDIQPCYYNLKKKEAEISYLERAFCQKEIKDGKIIITIDPNAEYRNLDYLLRLVISGIRNHRDEVVNKKFGLKDGYDDSVYVEKYNKDMKAIFYMKKNKITQVLKRFVGILIWDYKEEKDQSVDMAISDYLDWYHKVNDLLDANEEPSDGCLNDYNLAKKCIEEGHYLADTKNKKKKN